MSIEAVEPFVITYAKDDKGEDIPYRFILTIDRPWAEFDQEAFIEFFAHVPGIEAFSMETGRYSIEVIVARTFDPKAVAHHITEGVSSLPLEAKTEAKIVIP